MDIIVGPPPEKPAVRDSWHPEFETAIVEANGEWVSVPLTEIEGDTTEAKRSRISAVMNRRGHRLNTTIEDGRLFAKLNK